jgi:hypothetical protein
MCRQQRDRRDPAADRGSKAEGTRQYLGTSLPGPLNRWPRPRGRSTIARASLATDKPTRARGVLPKASRSGRSQVSVHEDGE